MSCLRERRSLYPLTPSLPRRPSDPVLSDTPTPVSTPAFQSPVAPPDASVLILAGQPGPFRVQAWKVSLSPVFQALSTVINHFAPNSLARFPATSVCAAQSQEAAVGEGLRRGPPGRARPPRTGCAHSPPAEAPASRQATCLVSVPCTWQWSWARWKTRGSRLANVRGDARKPHARRRGGVRPGHQRGPSRTHPHVRPFFSVARAPSVE